MDLSTLVSRLAALPSLLACGYGLALAVAMEAVTCLFRFGLGLQATRDTGFLARLTFGLRIHHGYVGLLLILLAALRPGLWRNLALIVGVGMLVSDLIHHFLVLWPITGSPQFDLTYPDPPEGP
ncbi:MAG: hypothetical protein ABIO70_28955 [Pseudomonadota bacterium]